MNDIGVSGASSGADVLAAVKGARSSKQDDGKGFIDALTSSLGNGRKSSGTNAGQDATATGTAADDNAEADGDTAKTAPGKTAAGNSAAIALAIDDSANAGVGMIDTSGANLAALAGLTKGAKPPQGTTAAALSKSLIELQKAASAAAEGGAAQPVNGDQPAVTADPATPAAGADKMPVQSTPLDQLAGMAQQLADIATTDGQVAPVKGDDKTPVVKGGKNAQSADDGKSTPTQDGQAANTISDALSLLNVPQPAVAAQAGAMPTGKAADDAKVQGMSLGKATLSNDTADATLAVPDDAKGSDASQTFRLTRADGRGGALDLSISKTADDAADVKVAASTGGDMPTVTVLDSRRYLGLASNSSLVAGTMAGDREWSAAMQPGSALSNAANLTSTGKVVNTLKIQLRPDNLGDVTATMRLSGDQLSVDLKVQTSEAYRQLHADQSRMVEALRAQGYQVDNITVSMASNADQQSDSSRSGSNQQQQSLLNQGQGGDARPKGQNYSGQQANGNDGNRSSGERGVEDGVAGSAQRPRSGAVYL